MYAGLRVSVPIRRPSTHFIDRYPLHPVQFCFHIPFNNTLQPGEVAMISVLTVDRREAHGAGRSTVIIGLFWLHTSLLCSQTTLRTPQLRFYRGNITHHHRKRPSSTYPDASTLLFQVTRFSYDAGRSIICNDPSHGPDATYLPFV